MSILIGFGLMCISAVLIGASRPLDVKKALVLMTFAVIGELGAFLIGWGTAHP